MVDARIRQRGSSHTKRVVRAESDVPNPFVPAEAKRAAAASIEVIVEQDEILRRLVSRDDRPVLFIGGD